MKTVVYVNVLGGPPFPYVLSKIKAHYDVWVIQPEQINAEEKRQLLSISTQVIFNEVIPNWLPFAEYLCRFAREKEAVAIITFDEFYLESVTYANIQLGLNCAGPNVINALRKDIMYSFMSQFNLLRRQYKASHETSELKEYDVGYPYLVKPSNCAGSLGMFLIRSKEEECKFETEMQGAKAVVSNVVESMPFLGHLKKQMFLKEGLLVGNNSAWFGSDAIYADYISVEGVVTNGTYHPVSITQNHPMIYPFIETVSMTPCTLPFDTQLSIVERIKPFIESLGLQYCGTHTEIKLLAGREIAVIETAARFAGWSIIPQIEDALNVDLIGEYLELLTNNNYTWSHDFERILRNIKGYAATINLLPADETGEPWEGETIYKNEPDFRQVISKCSTYKYTPYIGIGEVIKPLSRLHGAWNSFGKLYITSSTEQGLYDDIFSIRRTIRELIA